MNGLNRGVGTVGDAGNLRAADWLYRSRTASVLWLVGGLLARFRPAEEPVS